MATLPTRVLTHASRSRPLSVPVLGFGCAPMGNLFASVPDEDCRAAVDAARGVGVSMFDTAPWYGCGLSEHRLGAALRSADRDQVQISTKVGRHLRPNGTGDTTHDFWRGPVLPFDIEYDYTYDGVMRQHEASLQRLGTHRVDTLTIHDLDVDNHKSEAAVLRGLEQLGQGGGGRALDELRRGGDIAAVGSGLNDFDPVGGEYMYRRISDVVDLDFLLVAGCYTPLRHTEALDHLLPMCEDRGISVVIGGPFNSGILATDDPKDVANRKFFYKPPSDEIVSAVLSIQDVCKQFGVPVAAVALQFPLAHPVVKCVIPGAVTPAEVQQNSGNVVRPIPPELWSALKFEGVLRADCPTPDAVAAGVEKDS